MLASELSRCLGRFLRDERYAALAAALGGGGCAPAPSAALHRRFFGNMIS